MDMIVLFKLQIACFFVCIYVGILYFSSARQKTRLQRNFAGILIALPIYLISDIATVITVNHMDAMAKANDIAHRCFFILITLVVFLFFNHMNDLIEEEEGTTAHRKISRYISWIIMALADLFSLFVTPDYGATEVSGFAVASFAGGAFLAVGIYIVLIGVLLVRHWRVLPKKKKLAISVALIIETIGLYFQVLHTDLLLSGFILTFMMLAFYLTLDNPDALLLAQVEEQKERAEAANASKSAFLSVVSHEIRTPMNAVVGMTELLLRDEENLTEKQEQYLRNIKNSGESLVMIVNDILDQSKIEAGKMEIVEAPYEPVSMTEDVRLIIENRIGDAPVELHYEIDEKLPRFLVGDSLRIRQILINLMNNAVKFTESGSIRLKIAVKEREEDRILLVVSVSDTGQGIRPEDLEKLGEAFTQVDSKRNHSKEGTGLGLSISGDFIRMMGGQLQVASEYGEGSEFSFEIWQGIAEGIEVCPTTGVEKQAWREQDEFTAPQAKILIVDDSEINLMIASELLAPLQMQIDTADSGEVALELLAENRYHLVFMDYIMPHMDGAQTVAEIRKLGKVARMTADEEVAEYYEQVPVIALTGDTSEETRELLLQAGVSDFVTKPVDLGSLKSSLLRWLPAELIDGTVEV